MKEVKFFVHKGVVFKNKKDCEDYSLAESELSAAKRDYRAAEESLKDADHKFTIASSKAATRIQGDDS